MQPAPTPTGDLILGIDPGLRLTGYALLRASPHPSDRPQIVEAGVIRLTGSRAARASGGAEAASSPAGAASVAHRLTMLDRELRALLDRYTPAHAALEGLFSHPAFPTAGLVMGHARGVILLTLTQRRIPVVEVKPALVKKFLTGSGAADKGQMQRAVQEYFRLPQLPKPPDVADALAIALCAAHAHALYLPEQGLTLTRPRRAKRARTLPS